MSESATSINVRDATPADVDTIVTFNSAMAWETEGIELDGDRLRRGVSAVLDDPGTGPLLHRRNRRQRCGVN